MRFQLIRTYQGHQDRICVLVPVPGQPRFVSGSHDGLIKVWNVRSDSALTLRQGSDSYPTAIEIFPGGFFMAAGLSDGRLEIWNLETGEVVRRLQGHRSPVTATAITHNGQRLISGSQDRTLHIWNSLTGALLHSSMKHQTAIKTLAVTPDDMVVLVGESGDQANAGSSKAWQIETGLISAEYNEISGIRQYMAVLRNGRHVVTGSEEGNLILWDRETGERLTHIKAAPATVMTLMPDQKTMVVGTAAPGLALWDLSTGEKTYQFDEPSAEVISIAILTDGRYVIAGCQDGSLNLYMRVS